MTNEILEKLKAAKSVEELFETAKAEGAEIAPDEAKELFAKLNAEGEISEEELEAIAGGLFFFPFSFLRHDIKSNGFN